MTAEDEKAGERSPADAENLDPAYSSLEEQRADIAARAQHSAEIEAAIQDRAGRIEAELLRLFKGADAAEALRLAQRYATTAPVEPFPLARTPEAPADKPTLAEVRAQIKNLSKAAAARCAGGQRSDFALNQALVGMSPEALSLVLPDEREATMPRERNGQERPTLRAGLAVWARAQVENGDVAGIDTGLLLAGAEAALDRLREVRAKRGPKPKIDPVALAVMVDADLQRLTGCSQNFTVDGKYDNPLSDVLAVIFRENGMSDSPTEAARQAAAYRNNDTKSK